MRIGRKFLFTGKCGFVLSEITSLSSRVIQCLQWINCVIWTFIIFHSFSLQIVHNFVYLRKMLILAWLTIRCPYHLRLTNVLLMERCDVHARLVMAFNRLFLVFCKFRVVRLHFQQKSVVYVWVTCRNFLIIWPDFERLKIIFLWCFDVIVLFLAEFDFARWLSHS